jgi:hypothetical protein
MPTLAAIVVALLLAAPFAAQAQLPSLRVWPDTMPPCNGTLQACIEASLADDAIDVATNGPIDESLFLHRSLELAAAPGFRPVLAAGRGISAISDGGDRFYLVKGFRLLDGTISISSPFSGWLNAWVLDNEADGIAVGASQTGGPLSFRIEDNVLTPEFGQTTGIFVYASNAYGGGVQTNTVKGNTVTMPPTNDAVGISVSVADGSMTADVVGNRVTGSFYLAGIELSGDASPLTARVVGNLAVGAAEVGILVRAEGTDGVRDVDVVNNTVAGNKFGIIVAQRDARIANNVITGSAISGLQVAPSGAAVVLNDHNLFYDNDVDLDNQAAGPGSVFADPQYLDEVEFRPRPTSPVVDAGADDALPAGLTTDLAGEPRVLGTVDIGAYEVPEPAGWLATGAAAAGLALGARCRRGRRGRSKKKRGFRGRE